MNFVFSGEKKFVALLILVVVFGTTSEASLANNQLEVCHLLEGTQVVLATRNGSDAKAENLKVDPVDQRNESCGNVTDALRGFPNFDFGFRDRINIVRIYPTFVERTKFVPSNRTAYQSFSFLKELGKACSKGFEFSSVALVDFCIHVDNAMGICPTGDCDFKTPILSLDDWKQVIRIVDHSDLNKGGLDVNEFDFSVNDFTLAETANMSILFDDWRRQFWGSLNFSSYSTILRIALTFFLIILMNTGYLYWFERNEHVSDARVQGSEESYQNILRRAHPLVKISFKKDRHEGMFRVRAKMEGKKSTVTYELLSKKSYNDCYLWLLLRVPKKGEVHQAQGILRSFGIRETPAVNFLKCTAFFVYHISRSRNITDRVVAVTQWLDQILSLGLGYNIDIRLGDLYHFIRKMPEVKGNSSAPIKDGSRMKGMINVDYSSSDDDDAKVQGLADYADHLNILMKGVFNSSSIRACMRLLALVWHLIFVFKDNKIDWEHLQKWDTAMFQNLPEKALNVGATLLEQISTLATCSYEFYLTGDFNVFLKNDTEVTSYMENVEKICAEAKLVPIEPALNAGLPELEKRIHDLILKGETLRPKVKMALRPTFTSALMQLRSTALEVANIARASSTRAAPFSVLICGTPKIGKSSITSLIFRQFQLTNPYNEIMKNGLKLHDNGVYTRTLKEEYWSCYMNSYWGILFDDLGQTNPKVQEFALEINEIIQVVNNVMYFPPMAVAGDKGTRYVAPQIVLATTNNRDLNAHHAVRSPGAVLRRFPYVIVPTVRPEFATDGTLDAKKIKPGCVDLWTFTIEEVVVTNKGRDVKYVEIAKDWSTASMLSWVSEASKQHYQGQAKSDDYLKMISTSSLCDCCGRIKQFCACPPKEDGKLEADKKAAAAIILDAVKRGLPRNTLTQKLYNDALKYTPKIRQDVAQIEAQLGNIGNIGDLDDVVPELVEDDDDDDDSDNEIRREIVKHFSVKVPKRVRFEAKDASEIESSDDEARGGYSNMVYESSVRPQGLASSLIFMFVWRTLKACFIGYTGTFVVIWSISQLVLLVMFLERLATRPFAWMVSLYFRQTVYNYQAQVNDQSEFASRARSCRQLVWRMIHNCFSYSAADNALAMWVCGWGRTANWVRGSAVRVRQTCVANPRIIAAIAAVLISVSFLVWYYSTTGGWWPKVQVQGDDEAIPVGVKPPPADSNVENTWKTSNKLSYSALLSVQSKTGNMAWFEKIIEESTANFAFSAAQRSIIGFNIFGQFWLLPGHYMKSQVVRDSKVVTIRRASSIQSGMGAHTQAFEASSVIFCPDADYALVKLSTPPGVNLLPYVSVPAAGTSVSASCLFLRSDSALTIPASPLTFSNGTMAGVAIPAGLDPMYSFRKGRYITDFETLNGDCGSPCYINQAGNMTIIGMHVAVSENTPQVKFVNALPYKWLNQMLAAQDTCVCQGVLDMEKLDGKSIELDEDVHKKCPLRFEGLSGEVSGNSAIPIGAIKGIALNKLTSRVNENLFAPFWRRVGYVCEKVRPVLSSVKVPSWMPKRNFLLNACQHKDMIPESILEQVSNHFFKSFLSKIPVRSIEKVVIIDEETNLYGADGNNFISHMRFDTGAGFPHNKPKYEVLDRVEHPKFPDGTCAVPAAMKRKIDNMEKTASKGLRINMVFNSSLKDEPISKVKLEAGKIRVFQAICVEGLFLLRKYFLSIIALFQTWNFASEAAIGMDATGPDWDDLHDYIFVDNDWQVFCGDYSNYDQRMGSSIMMHAWRILIAIAGLSMNYPWVAIRIMHVLAVECCYCVTNFFGDMIMLNGSNPSGHGLTVVINSICNSMYLRVAWINIFGDLEDFNNNYIRVMTYGDDNIVSVHPKYQARFNQVTVTEALAKYGIVYTDAQKSGRDAKPFCGPGEISFLKRSWRKSEYGFYHAPLEIASIHKMLIIGVDKRSVAEGDRLASVLISSCMEAFQHGEEFFHDHLALVLECVKEYNLERWVEEKGGLPTFQGLLEKRLAKISRLDSVQHLFH